MTIGTHKEHRRERGSSMMEFCFTIPTLLVIAGATVDLSRYMRYAQVTTFVSQESASQIYRQCSDLTIYNRPVQGSGAVTVDINSTRTAVAQCIERIQAASQLVLNKALGSSALSSNVFRWQIGVVNPAPNCANATSDSVTRISVAGDTTPDLCDSDSPGENNYLVPISRNSGMNTQPVVVNSGTRQETGYSPPDLSSTTLSSLQTSSVTLQHGGIYQQGKSTPMISTQNICNRGRVVVVEVAYAFSPIVKFLPNMMIQLDTTGRRRDISIL